MFFIWSPIPTTSAKQGEKQILLWQCVCFFIFVFGAALIYEQALTLWGAEMGPGVRHALFLCWLMTAELGGWQSWSWGESNARQQPLPRAPRCHCVQGTSKPGVLQGFLELVFVFPFAVVFALPPFLTLCLALLYCCFFLSSLLRQTGKLWISPGLLSSEDMNF